MYACMGKHLPNAQGAVVRAISSLQVALERDALDAVGDYECPAGMSVEDVSAVVKIKIKTLKRDSRLIAHKLETGQFVGVVRRRPENQVSLQASISVVTASLCLEIHKHSSRI